MGRWTASSAPGDGIGVTGIDESVASPWLETPDQVATRLATDLEHGLGESDAALRLQRHGRNELLAAERPTPARLLARQFVNTMVLILAVAGVVTYLVGDRTDSVVIAVIVVLNAVAGFVQEYRAERAMDELTELTSDAAVVVRAGTARDVPATELVPGDVVRLVAGDVVPADVRLVHTAGLRVAEAALTGESEPVDKSVHALAADTGFVGDRENMAYKGTAIVDGRGEAVVVATGMATELGSIAAMLTSGRITTPLQRRLASLGHRLAIVAIGLCVVVFTAGVARGEPASTMLVTAVSLAVAAIPEGLPAVVTVALALGARRMARQRALIRRLPAVETLGAVTVICTDKTGTLTQNRMAVERVWTASAIHGIEGDGYSPSGRVTVDGVADRPPDPDLASAGRIAAACNDAAIHETDDGWVAVGDPTEGALLTMAHRVGSTGVVPARVAEIPFDPGRRRMATVHDGPDGTFWIAVKGALDALVPLLAGDAPVDEVVAAGDALAADGYRVLALAERTIAGVPADLADVERDLRLVALVGISDPLRPGVAGAVATCGAAGVATVMITGDHPRTAGAIGRRLGLVTSDAAVMTGQEVDELDDDALTERVEDVRVFARSSPAQKLRIVDAWRRRGAVVAMTGDGVNDAPALQRADIGIAMGRSGTGVSREAADMVLADDNFVTIVSAVHEGRRIFDNLRRFVRYLLTTNSSEVWVMLAGPFLGLPLPLTAAQILWINLVTDGLPAVALGLEPAEPDTMRRPPRSPRTSILSGGLWQQSVVVGLLMAGIVLPLELFAEARDWPWRTMGFTTLALLQLGNALSVRSETRSLRAVGLRSNPVLVLAVIVSMVAQLATVYVPFLQEAFDTEPLTALHLAVVIPLSTVTFFAVEGDKVRRRRARERAATGSGGQVAERPSFQ